MFNILCLTFYLAQKQVGHGDCDDGDIGFLIRSGGTYPSYMLSRFTSDVLLKENAASIPKSISADSLQDLGK